MSASIINNLSRKGMKPSAIPITQRESIKLEGILSKIFTGTATNDSFPKAAVHTGRVAIYAERETESAFATFRARVPLWANRESLLSNRLDQTRIPKVAE